MNHEELKMFLAAVIPEIVKGIGGGREAKTITVAEGGSWKKTSSTGWISSVGRKSYTRSWNITSG